MRQKRKGRDREKRQVRQKRKGRDREKIVKAGETGKGGYIQRRVRGSRGDKRGRVDTEKS